MAAVKFSDKRPLLLAIAAYIFARLAGGRLPFALLYMVAGAILISYVWIRHNLRNLSHVIDVDRRHLQVGETLSVKVRLYNEGFLPIPAVEMKDMTGLAPGEGAAPGFGLGIEGLGSRALNYSLRAGRRGHFPTGPLVCTLSDVFGLFSARKEFHSRLAVTVYPRVVPLNGLSIPLTQPYGPVRTRHFTQEDLTSLAEIRPFRSGDNPKRIHWKVSARQGSLQVKDYELTASTELYIFLDLKQSSHVGAGTLSTEETAIEIAASMAHEGLLRGLPVALLTYGKERIHLPPAKGQRMFHQILEALARARGEGQVPLEEILAAEAGHLTHSSTAVIITPVLTPALFQAILRLKGRHGVVLFLIRAETYAPDLEIFPHRDQMASYLASKDVSVVPIGAGDDLRRVAPMRSTSRLHPVMRGDRR